ncbi:MbnP family copper-binding protein [Paraglaciecola sp.]|uniref:MbnP family copper-binding protein n=1 Tax=Paraglaciecola sp. TaxID=1920173 RepID=UPI00273EEB18|nr:MbnP family copper-binding protein [Paraglaciecola sp.]MDP5029308.1 metallo-mystery pair system four-Cys motif protein [Paraglaciecola sp.]
MPLLHKRIITVITQKMINDRLTTRCRFLHQAMQNTLVLVFILLSSACSKLQDKPALSEIKVEVFFQQAPIRCEQIVSLDEQNWRINQLAFFISELNVSQNGVQQALPLTTNDWQSNDVALLQYTDCAEQASQTEQSGPLISAYHASLQLAEPIDFSEVMQLQFTLGIPFELNHLNPLSQASPLNIPSMFWSWRAGHKFMRLDMLGDEQSWVFHLGSTECYADSAMRAPTMQCGQPNRLTFDLPKQQQGETLILHLDRLLSGVALNNKTACLMQPDQESCVQIMKNMADNQVFEWQ